MATTLTATVQAGISIKYDGGDALLTDIVKLAAADGAALTNGTAADNADLVYAGQRTISGSSSENLDLAGGLTDPFGTTLTFVEIRGVFVSAATANGGNIIVGGAASNAWTGPFADSTDKVKIPAGGRLILFSPVDGQWTVTAGTGDILKVENDDAGSATYDLVILGTSA